MEAVPSKLAVTPEGKPDKLRVIVPAFLPESASAVITIDSLSSPCFAGGKLSGEADSLKRSLLPVTKNSSPAHMKSVVHKSIAWKPDAIWFGTFNVSFLEPDESKAFWLNGNATVWLPKINSSTTAFGANPDADKVNELFVEPAVEDNVTIPTLNGKNPA